MSAEVKTGVVGIGKFDETVCVWDGTKNNGCWDIFWTSGVGKFLTNAKNLKNIKNNL